MLLKVRGLGCGVSVAGVFVSCTANSCPPPPPEWRNLATHCGHADMLQFLQDVDACIFREIVAQDSLYVRI